MHFMCVIQVQIFDLQSLEAVITRLLAVFGTAIDSSELQSTSLHLDTKFGREKDLGSCTGTFEPFGEELVIKAVDTDVFSLDVGFNFRR